MMSLKKTISLLLAVFYIITLFPVVTVTSLAYPPDGITLSPDSIEGHPGEWYSVYPEFHPDGSDWENVWWESSDESVVTFNSYYCEAYLVAPGTATLTATSESGLYATCVVTVKSYPVIALGETVEISVDGNREFIYYEFTPEEDGWYRLFSSGNCGYGATLYSAERYWLAGAEWDSNNFNYYIDYQMEAGVTYLYCFDTGYDSWSYTASVEKLVSPVSISLDMESYEGYPTEKITLTVNYSPENAIREDVIWSSTNVSVARVNYYGRVTLVGPGRTVIKATTDNGLKTECTVTVKRVPALVLGERESVTIEEEGGYAYFVFTPDEDMTVEFVGLADGLDTEGAILDSSGYTVNSSSYGGDGNNFSFSATLYEGETYYFRVGLNQTNIDYPISFPISVYRIYPAGSLYFAEGTSGMRWVGESFELTPIFYPEQSIIENIEWSSSDTSVAEVQNGIVFLNGIGVATITAKAINSGLTAKYEIKVYDPETIAFPHDHVWSEWVTRSEPTCTENGEEYSTCSLCFDEKVQIINALGHSYESEVVNPSCTEIGYSIITCLRCGNSYITDEIDAFGHDYVGVVTEPTCTEDGYTTITCSRCGDTFISDTINAKGHAWGKLIEVNEATDTETGLEKRICSVCGIIEEIIIPVIASDAPLMKVSSDTVDARTTVTLDVDVKNNPGFSSAILRIDYDTEKLTLIDAVLADGVDGQISFIKTIAWLNNENWSEDGTFLKLTFLASEIDEPCETRVRVGYDAGNISDENENDIDFFLCSGIVKMSTHVPGDINGDGVVNSKDLTRLLKYVSGGDVTVNEKALDVNGDGVVNSKDLTRLLKFLSGVDVVIF